MDKNEMDSNIDDILYIKKLFHHGSSFYINFQLDESADLCQCIENGCGFSLKRVYIHPNKQKKDTFVLEIAADFPNNKYLQIELLAKLFPIINIKRKSPNLKEFFEIQDFEAKYKRPLGSPKKYQKKI
jgi:hypothetical protein